MPTMNQIDQLNASFTQQANVKEILADDICNEVDTLSRANGSTNEEDSMGKREADCFSRVNMSVNEDASNEKRVFLRRRSTHVSYKEPKLNTKLRRSGPTVSTQKLFQSDNHITSNVLESLEKARQGDITNVVESSSRINLLANEENKDDKRVGSKQCPSNSINGDPNLNANTKHQEHNLQTLDKISKDQALHFDVPQSESAQLDLNEISEDTKTEDITSKATRVQLQPVQEIDPRHASVLNTALEETKLRPSTRRSVPNAAESVTSSKEIPLDNVGEAKKQQCNVPRKIEYLSKFSKCPQNCALPATEGITNKVTRVQQHQLQENAPSNPSIFDTALDAAELRRSSTGRPVRKAVETVASYREIPLNIKMRRSQ